MTRTIRLLLAAAALGSAGCGDRDDATRVGGATVQELRGSQAQAPASAVAAALTQVRESPESQERLGYVNLARIGEVDERLPRASILRRVLGPGAVRLAAFPDGAAQTAVQVGPATVVRGTGAAEAAASGVDSGRDGVVLGADAEFARVLQDTRPVRTALSSVATAAVQSCLGDAAAQVILGNRGLDTRDAAAGVGLRASQDPPAGVQLVVCYAPRFVRQIGGTIEVFEKRFGDLSGGPDIRELEIGEREMFSGALPVADLQASQVSALLGAGEGLLALLVRK